MLEDNMAKNKTTRHIKSQHSNTKEDDTSSKNGQPEENTEVLTGHKNRADERVNRKRKADPASDPSLSKKTKPSNDGMNSFYGRQPKWVLPFVGNLNITKTSEEIKNSLMKYFTMQNLLFQDIRLVKSRKHAFVDMASDMDLTKALGLNGEEILNKPMKIAKAKVKSNNEGKVKASPLDKKVKDGRCLFLKNVPSDATEEDIRKVFRKAILVRFPGGAKSPTQGIAFVEFKNKAIAKEMLKKKQKAQIKGRDLIVDCVRQRDVAKATGESKNTRAAAPSTNVLFVKHLPENVKEKHLKNVFRKAVHIRIPPMKEKPNRFAFVEFATAADAKKALQSSKTIKICNKAAKVEMCRNTLQQEDTEGQLKTLFVVGLAEKTTAETLQSAFGGAISARVAVHKNTGASKRFGFVEFDSEEKCKAAKDDMEYCEIDGSKVTVTYAVSKVESSAGPPSVPPSGQQSGKNKGKKTGEWAHPRMRLK